MIAGVFLYTVSSIGYVLTCMQVLKYQPVIHFAGFITNLVACFFLVKRYHLEGAAYAWIISFIVQLVLSAVILQIAYSRRIINKAVLHA
jgi:O-antigen/teichoic acid export membrane protein